MTEFMTEYTGNTAVFLHEETVFVVFHGHARIILHSGKGQIQNQKTETSVQ